MKSENQIRRLISQLRGALEGTPSDEEKCCGTSDVIRTTIQALEWTCDIDTGRFQTLCDDLAAIYETN